MLLRGQILRRTTKKRWASPNTSTVSGKSDQTLGRIEISIVPGRTCAKLWCQSQKKRGTAWRVRTFSVQKVAGHGCVHRNSVNRQECGCRCGASLPAFSKGSVRNRFRESRLHCKLQRMDHCLDPGIAPVRGRKHVGRDPELAVLGAAVVRDLAYCSG